MCPLISRRRGVPSGIFPRKPRSPHADFHGIGAGGRNIPPANFSRVDKRQFGRGDALDVDAHGYHHVDAHVRGLVGRQLQCNGRTLLKAEVDGLIAADGGQPNLVGGNEVEQSRVLRTRNDRRVDRHEVDAHVLAEEAVTRPLQSRCGSAFR